MKILFGLQTMTSPTDCFDLCFFSIGRLRLICTLSEQKAIISHGDLILLFLHNTHHLHGRFCRKKEKYSNNDKLERGPLFFQEGTLNAI